MDRDSFEGSLVLEKLAEVNKVDEFFEAVDSDNFQKAKSLMENAGVDVESIEITLRMMGEADSEHL